MAHCAKGTFTHIQFYLNREGYNKCTKVDESQASEVELLRRFDLRYKISRNKKAFFLQRAAMIEFVMSYPEFIAAAML